MLKRLAALTLCLLPTFAQVPNVAISKEPANEAVTTFTYYSGGIPQYICKALSRQPAYTWAVTPASNQGTLTSIAVAANVGTVTVTAAHGFDTTRALGAVVTVAGSTTAALNGTYAIQTIGSSTTFTIATSGVGNGTYNTAALVISTTAPRTTAAMWSVETFINDGTNITGDKWAANLTSGSGGSTAKTFICANQSTLAYQ